MSEGLPVSDLPNEQQSAAIDARGSTFVSAGAGTGKTTVLVERFCRAVVDDGLDVDSLLVITYTDRAAGELRARIRARLLELERPDLARDLDGAWISTIHSLLPPAPHGQPAGSRHRSPLSRARRGSGEGAAGRSLRRRPGGVLRRRRARPLAVARDLPDRRPAFDARQRLRHPSLRRARVETRAGGAREPRRRHRGARRRGGITRRRRESDCAATGGGT